MSQQTNPPIRLKILGKEVQVACEAGEEDDLLNAAAYVHTSMQELRQRSNMSSLEKIAIVTAINTANALLKCQTDRFSDDQALHRLKRMHSQLDQLDLPSPHDGQTSIPQSSNPTGDND